MDIKKHIPNFITILNLVCGVFAILFFLKSVYGYGKGGCLGDTNFELIIKGVFLIILATILDFLDGFAARLLKVQSEIGAQLDSLADMVTFGVAPGFLFYACMEILYDLSDISFIQYGQFLFILIPVFSALRLAKFNVDTEQTTYFKGLATPSNALFWVGMAIILHFANIEFAKGSKNLMIPIQVQVQMLGTAFITFVILLSLLMTSNLRMFSLKLKNLKLEGDNIYRLILVLGAVILTISFWLFTNILAAIPFIILLYILLSIHYHYTTRKTL